MQNSVQHLEKQEKKRTAAVICFTPGGLSTGKAVRTQLTRLGYDTRLGVKSRHMTQDPDPAVEIIHESLFQWTGAVFSDTDALVFVGASGIAVRAIAPYVADKRRDPAVLVLDEGRQFVISLLSGHLGGANEITQLLADALGAVPVITTATDVRDRFAVDVFAKNNHLWISDMKLAKEVSARLLREEEICITVDPGMEDAMQELVWAKKVPRGLRFVPWEESAERRAAQKETVWIHLGVASYSHLGEQTLYLVPRQVVLGMGCRRGTSYETIRGFMEERLLHAGIFQEAIVCLASIDLKAAEPGMLKLAEVLQIPFICYSAEELLKAPGTYQASAFVKSVTGVDNVCERSAVLASEKGRLIMKKQSAGGVTAACAIRDWRIHFE